MPADLLHGTASLLEIIIVIESVTGLKANQAEGKQRAGGKENVSPDAGNE